MRMEMVFMKKHKVLLTAFICTSFFLCSCAKSDPKVELTVSAAASLKEAMTDIEKEFEKNSNIDLILNFGASGSLQQQIEQGAPCDVFISAGQKQMNTLEDKSLLLEDTRKDLLKNSLVLIGPKDTSLDKLLDIKNSAVKHIAMGDPSSVPAGKYADEVIENLSIKNDISSKLVFAKDVKEVLAWVASGNAEVGFVYKSDALVSDSVKIIENIDKQHHSPITYPVAAIKSSKKTNECKSFIDFLFIEDSQKIFEKYGYVIIKE